MNQLTTKFVDWYKTHLPLAIALTAVVGLVITVGLSVAVYAAAQKHSKDTHIVNKYLNAAQEMADSA
jgi:Tfp pilus assembly protein FimV